MEAFLKKSGSRGGDQESQSDGSVMWNVGSPKGISVGNDSDRDLELDNMQESFTLFVRLWYYTNQSVTISLSKTFLLLFFLLKILWSIYFPMYLKVFCKTTYLVVVTPIVTRQDESTFIISILIATFKTSVVKWMVYFLYYLAITDFKTIALRQRRLQTSLETWHSVTVTERLKNSTRDWNLKRLPVCCRAKLWNRIWHYQSRHNHELSAFWNTLKRLSTILYI